MKFVIFNVLLLISCGKEKVYDEIKQPQNKLNTATSQDSNSKTWLISGQSNACNRYPGKSPFSPNFNVTVLNNSLEFETAVEPLPGFCASGTGIWQHAADVYNQKTGIPVKIAGYALGGMPIEHWDVDELGWSELSKKMHFVCPNVDTFIWYQGENNSEVGRGSSAEIREELYLQQLKKFMSRVRNFCNKDSMKIIVIELGIYLGDNTLYDFESIRRAQKRFVNEDNNASLVTAKEYPLFDNVHLTQESYYSLGEKIANLLIH